MFKRKLKANLSNLFPLGGTGYVKDIPPSERIPPKSMGSAVADPNGPLVKPAPDAFPLQYPGYKSPTYRTGPKPKPHKLDGMDVTNPYIVQYMLWSFPDRTFIRVGVDAVEGDEVWMSIPQFLSLMDWGAQERETLEQLREEQA